MRFEIKQIEDGRVAVVDHIDDCANVFENEDAADQWMDDRRFDEFVLLLGESIQSMKLTRRAKENAKAVLRAAIEYAAMKRKGFVLGRKT